MDASPVFGLGYVRVWEADLAQWRQFAEGVLGMTAEHDGEGRLLVRMDDWIGRFIVEEGRGPLAEDSGRPASNVAIGWECPSEEAWAKARRAIEDAGVPTQGGSGPTAWCRDWFGCMDPSGFRCEFFYGGKRDPASQFVSPRGVTFVTGEQGMGHVLLFAGEPAKSLDFYSRVLGFQVREAKTADDGTLRAVFLGPNQREHSLALLGIGDASRLGHVLIEVERLRRGRQGDGPVPGRDGPDDRLDRQALERPDDLVLPADAVRLRHRVRLRGPEGRNGALEPGGVGRQRAHEHLGPPENRARWAPRSAPWPVAEVSGSCRLHGGR